jgi:UDP-glucose 4-epimerase
LNVLVVGGAGYIGSHAVRALAEGGHHPVVLDNLCLGHRGAAEGFPLEVCDLMDRSRVEAILRAHRIELVMHFAAFAAVGESVVDPSIYYGNNVVATWQLLEAMRAADVQRFIFSSTTATYGEPKTSPIVETTPQDPINPYGRSKRIVEQMLRDYGHAYGLASVALRYFNAAGACLRHDIGEDHHPETHLIPILLQVALGQRPHMTIFGDDYPTEDGTCVRDYTHVDDLASAHLLAIEQLKPSQFQAFNLGSGTGSSVREVVEMARRVTGHPIPTQMGSRRPGDPPHLVADIELAKSVLGWRPASSDLETIVRSAWNWHARHPRGYDDRSESPGR